MTMVVDYISRKLGNILVISCFITKTSSPELCQETTLRQYSFKGCSVLGGWFSIVQTWFRWFRWFGLVGEMVQILCLSDLVFIILFTLKNQGSLNLFFVFSNVKSPVKGILANRAIRRRYIVYWASESPWDFLAGHGVALGI